mgnify:FL=1|tara:strand:+ start:832 stop:1350 length:519 start_codon:yes stop_codon:yes gene_type:complete
MIYRYLFFTIILFTCFSCKNKTEKATKNKELFNHYYFIRHAEKDRSNPDDDNPNLTNEGMLRAEKLSTILNDVNLDAVYSTNYNRTLQTAKPTANKNDIEITIYKPSELDVTKILKAHKNILVVGHSNTIPQLVNTIIKNDIYKDIEDNNFGNLYHITVTNGQVSGYTLTSY